MGKGNGLFNRHDRKMRISGFSEVPTVSKISYVGKLKKWRFECHLVFKEFKFLIVTHMGKLLREKPLGFCICAKYSVINGRTSNALVVHKTVQ